MSNRAIFERVSSRLLSVARPVILLAASVLLVVRTAAAQPAAADAGSRRPIGSVSAGVMQFDLSGTGTTPVVALRVDLPWSTHLWFEPGVVIARPAQDFGDTTVFAVAEVHAHAMMPLGALAPYVGGGVGTAFDFRKEEDGGTQHALSLAAALGVRFQLAARAGARVELRVRALETDFASTTAEWTAGVSWRF